jgi:UDP-GlcNAc:undecaprenyl-phosphate GlcNAc-1-phosphate transferase
MLTLAVFAGAVVLGLAATYAARGAGRRFGLVDRPDGRRKIHARPVPVSGGLGVLTAAVAALGLAAALFPEVADGLFADPGRAVALLSACGIIAVVGVIDDVHNLRARYKLAGQLVAALILVGFGGFRVEQVSVLGSAVPLGWVSWPATVFWFLAAINALNLLDGMDGLLGTIGVIATGALACMAFAAGHPFAGWVAVALAGSLVGFLRFNLPPASLYLGDCGSMLIGLVVGALAIEASLKGPAVAIVAPAALLVLPILDTAAAIVRRKLTGRGIAAPDRGHLHHVMLRKGLTRRWALVVAAGLAGLAAGGALAGTFLNNDLFAALSAVAVVLVLIVTGLFGTAEVRLIKERAPAVYRAAAGRGGPHVELSVRLQGTADWAGLWRQLVRAALDMGLHSVRLDVNAPALHEGFHGRWDRSRKGPDELTAWQVELPLHGGSGQVIGRLTAAGVRSDASMAEQFAQLARVVADVEVVAARLTPAARQPDAAPVSASA